MYSALAPMVHGLALRILRDPHQAEEVTQEVFLQAWLGSAGFDPCRGSARTWLMMLAHRRTVDRVRSAESSRHRDHRYADDPTRAAPTGPEDVVEASAEVERLTAALAGLSHLQRQAIELSYFGGHTHVEVSRLLGVPLGTAKWRIREGLGRLRDALLPLVPESA